MKIQVCVKTNVTTISSSAHRYNKFSKLQSMTNLSNYPNKYEQINIIYFSIYLTESLGLSNMFPQNDL